MEKFVDYLKSQGFSVELNPTSLEVMDASKDLIIIRDSGVGESQIQIASGVKLNMLEILVGGAQGRTNIVLEASSQLYSTHLQLGSSQGECRVEFSGRDGEVSINMLQLLGGSDEAKFSLRIEHNSADCRSYSLSKCIASGESYGEFRGLIYVAREGQRTLAEQSSRNIQLSGTAHISAEPQLEIYADDVKCSHGATVGQMNEEAIYYMMQRGLSEEQARKLQLEGFVQDVTKHCTIEGLIEPLSELVSGRLSEL